MKTAIIGYPRIGENRELKFAIEKYWKNEITENELLKIAEEIRRNQWLKQKEEKISFIPGNTFSFYDAIIDKYVISVKYIYFLVCYNYYLYRNCIKVFLYISNAPSKLPHKPLHIYSVQYFFVL